MKTEDLVLHRRAARQLGLVTRTQLGGLGLTRRQIESRLGGGLLVPLHCGVFRLASAPATWEQRVLAACLAAGPGALVSHRAAAKLWGFRGIERAPFEILVGRDWRPSLDGVIVHRTSKLHRADVTRRGVLPITTPARTLFDLAAVIDASRLEGAAEGVMLTRQASWDRLVAVGRRLAGRGHAGSGELLRLLEARGPAAPTDSGAEDDILSLLRAAGLPEPDRQIPVPVPGRRKPVYLDLGYSDRRLAIEVDSRTWHGGRSDVQRNSSKANTLVAAGWRVLHFTADDVRRRPAYVVDCVVRELRRAC